MTIEGVQTLKKTGMVQRGIGQGQVYGYPTANIACDTLDVRGTFAGLVEWSGRQYQAAVYADAARKVLEVHLFDFHGDLYGQTITIVLLQQISAVEPFVNDDQMKQKIDRDIAQVRAFFQSYP